MASLANANLPSSDEEDDDYNPALDPTGEKEPGQQQQQGANRKRRGAFAAEDGADEQPDNAAAPAATPAAAAAAAAADDDNVLTPAQTAKKARIGAMWEQLQVASTGSVGKLSRSSISLASLCSNTDPKKKRNTDLLWMRNLGITPGSKGKAAAGTPAATPTSNSKREAAAAAASPGTTPPPTADAAADGSSEQQQQADERLSALRAAAAAALAAAKEGALGGVVANYNKVTVKETRRFAGKEIEVELQVDKDSKEAKRAAEEQKAAAAAAGGLDAFLQQIESKKKVTVLDKTKMDWQEMKAADASLQEELEAHKRSDKQYLDRQDFLKRAELREYELERDKRLAADVRLRGRL